MNLTAKRVSALRKSYEDGLRRCCTGGTYRRARRREEPQTTYTGTVRDLLREGGGSACAADLCGLSPVPVSDMTPQEQTTSFLLRLWRPTDLLFVTHKGADFGRVGVNIRPAGDWARVVESGGVLPGDIVTPNPLTGEGVPRMNAGGREYLSYICADCLTTVRPYAVLEMDDLPECMQLAFWLGFLRRSPLARTLVSLVHSGGRSIHGLLCMRAADPFSWERNAQKLRSLFCSDPETRVEAKEDGSEKTVHPFRADAQALRPLTKTRIPGVCRGDNGNVQRLLYFNPDAMPNAGQSDQVAQNVHPDGGTGMEQTAREPPPERPRTRPAPKTDEDARRMDGRARGRIFRLPRDSEPPRTEQGAGFTPLDEILADFDAIESARACGI